MTEQEFGIKSAQLLRPFAHEFGLEYYPVDELTTILIGNGFALLFASWYADTDVSYWRLFGKKLLDYAVADYYEAAGYCRMYEEAGDEERLELWSAKMADAESRLGDFSGQAEKIKELLNNL